MVLKYVVSAFSRVDGGGNPAGVVLHADLLKENEMQEIASELGYSETAFLMSSNCSFVRIRYFTPVEEVRLCGHATIASIGLLKHLKLIEEGEHKVETGAGVLIVMVHSDKIMLEMERPVFYKSMDRKQISDSLGINEEDINETPPPQIVSTGLKDLIFGVRSIEILRNLKPDFKKISEISAESDMAGYHVYCIGVNGEVHTRNFAPLLGIPEESATGTASGALAVYLYENNIIPKSAITMKTFYQGMFMGRPSEIEILLTKLKDGLKVYVGGGVSDIVLID